MCKTITFIYWESMGIIDKGRHNPGVPAGESHGCHKLTEIEVREILSYPEAKGIGIFLAHKYGISTTQIYDIRNKKSWKHIQYGVIK